MCPATFRFQVLLCFVMLKKCQWGMVWLKLLLLKILQGLCFGVEARTIIMPSKVARTATRNTAAKLFFATKAQNPWGIDIRRHEKFTFIKWCKAAAAPEPSVPTREFYGFIATVFRDVDMDKDGMIHLEQFD